VALPVIVSYGEQAKLRVPSFVAETLKPRVEIVLPSILREKKLLIFRTSEEEAVAVGAADAKEEMAARPATMEVNETILILGIWLEG